MAESRADLAFTDSHMNAKHTEGALNLVYPFQEAGSCDSITSTCYTQKSDSSTSSQSTHWLMHGDLEMPMGFLKLQAFPFICLAFICETGDPRLGTKWCYIQGYHQILLLREIGNYLVYLTGY